MGRPGGPLLPGEWPAAMGSREAEFSRALHEQADKVVAENHYDLYLHSNTTDTNHKRTDATLFVERTPHQVRSFAETGAWSKVDNEQKRFLIGLNDAVWKPEHAINSFQMSEHHELCVCCLDVLNYFCKYREERPKWDAIHKEDKKVFHLPNTIIHHANLVSLYAQAQVAKCHICNILVRRIRARWDITSYMYEDYRVEMAFPQSDSHGKHDDNLNYFMVRNDQKKYPVWNWSPVLTLSLWPEDKYRWRFKAFTHADYIRAKRVESGETMEEDEREKLPSPNELAKAWLVKCIFNEAGNHSRCQRENPGYLPTRLLDVTQFRETSRIRLVSPQDEPALFPRGTKYATLSHCWGSWGASENPNLVEANLVSRQRDGIDGASLPKTFHDALVVCTWLRIPFLWIDSLCIIQDSRADWIHEASVMHKIYEYGVVNISASFGEDSRAGLFADRDPKNLTLQRFYAPKIPRMWYVTPNNMFEWALRSPAFSRAWIHRERQIAPRILHFTDQGMVVWECCGTNGSGFASETLPGGAPFEELWYGNIKYQAPATLSESKKGAEATYAIWDDLCERFSTRMLTVKSDMPIILSSLAEEFHKSLPDDEYVAGMWRNTLPQSLAWHTKDYWPPSEDNKQIAPSWSWLSAPAPIEIKFLERVRMNRLLPLAKVVDVDIIPEEGHENNEYGPVKSGTLRLEGFMRKIWFDFHEDGKFDLSVVDTWTDGDEDNNDISHLRDVGKSWDKREGQVCTVEFDGEVTEKSYCCWCMFTSFEEWVSTNDWHSQDRTITAILLEDLSEDGGGGWYRTGTLTMKDVMAFKMRYKSCPPSSSKPRTAQEPKHEGVPTVAQANDDRDEEAETMQQKQKLDNISNDKGAPSGLSIKDNEPPKATADSTPPKDDANDQDSTKLPKMERLSISTSTTEHITNTNVDFTSNPTKDPDPTPNGKEEEDSANSSPTSPHSPRRNVWDDLATIIKYERFELAVAEEKEEKKKREARKAAKKKRKEEEDGSGGRMVLDSAPEPTTEPASEVKSPDQDQKDDNDTTVASTDETTIASHDSDTDNDTATKESSDNLNATGSDPTSTNQPLNPLTDPTIPPIHGFIDKHLSLLETLYQFDAPIVRYQAEGDLKWLRRLDLRKIEII